MHHQLVTKLSVNYTTRITRKRKIKTNKKQTKIKPEEKEGATEDTGEEMMMKMTLKM